MAEDSTGETGKDTSIVDDRVLAGKLEVHLQGVQVPLMILERHDI